MLMTIETKFDGQSYVLILDRTKQIEITAQQFDTINQYMISQSELSKQIDGKKDCDHEWQYSETHNGFYTNIICRCRKCGLESELKSV